MYMHVNTERGHNESRQQASRRTEVVAHLVLDAGQHGRHDDDRVRELDDLEGAKLNVDCLRKPASV